MHNYKRKVKRIREHAVKCSEPHANKPQCHVTREFKLMAKNSRAYKNNNYKNWLRWGVLKNYTGRSVPEEFKKYLK